MIFAYPNCEICQGTGKVTRPMHQGFFSYREGDVCPECNRKNQQHIAAEAGVYIRPGDEIETRLKRLEEAVFGERAQRRHEPR